MWTHDWHPLLFIGNIQVFYAKDFTGLRNPNRYGPQL